MSTNDNGQVSAQIDTKQMLGAVKFEIGKLYYTYSPIDAPDDNFVGKYIGVNGEGMHEFENSKGKKFDVLFGYFFKEATEAEIKAYY